MKELGQIVMVSDVHLRRPDDSRGKALIMLLDSLCSDTTKVFCLLGDIFDFYLGLSSHYDKVHQPLIDALGRASKRGIDVVLVEGNHEFRMKKAYWPGVRIVDDLECCFEVGSQKVVVCHGDMIDPPLSYRWFRNLVKSKFVTGIAAALPQSFVESYVFSHCSVSKSAHQFKKMDHHKLLNAAMNRASELKADIFLFGHFHTPYYLSEKGTQIACSPSWDQINLLSIYEDGKIKRGFYRNEIWQMLDIKRYKGPNEP